MPACDPDGDTLSYSASGQGIYNQLVGVGYTISLVRDRDAAAGDANGKALIIISSSTFQNWVEMMYKNSPVPAMIWDGAILSDMGMVTSTGSVNNKTQINIIDASHPMADGHSNGNVTIATTGTKVRWGFPTASADSIAEVAGQPNKSAIFAYQTGDSMNGLNAPHRRVGFFIDSTTPVDLNANGWGLFDAAVDWAINGGSSTFMPNPNQATAAAGAFKGNRMGKRGMSAKIQAISGSIQRISLSFAGQPVAVQVSGDPDPANNGLFHIYADHLGSTGSLSDSSGVYIPDSHAKYTPFGDWRTEPTATASDRYYTGHKHNNLGGGADDLGLIYMNARFYLPGVGRFASADTIVPDATNPQAYNRYSYVNNNPMGYVDPSGHCAETGDDACWSYYDRVIQLCPECAGLGWEQWGYNFQRDMYNWLNNGGQLGESTTFSVDYDALAEIAGGIELSLDTYDEFYKAVSGISEGIVPGPIGLGLVLIQAGNQNKDETLTRMGYEMLAYVGIDAVVDAGAAGAAAYVGEKVFVLSGANPLAAGLAAGGTFLTVQIIYEVALSDQVDQAVDYIYESSSQTNNSGVNSAPAPVPVRAPRPLNKIHTR